MVHLQRKLWPLCVFLILVGCQTAEKSEVLIEAAYLDYGEVQHLYFSPPEEPQYYSPTDHPKIIEEIPLDLWERTRKGFQISYNEMHPDIQYYIRQYQQNPQHIQTLVQRAKPYFYLIIDAIEKQRLPMELAYLPMVESALDPFAHSHGQAAGIWQIVPGTADLLGLHRDWWYDGRRDIVSSTDAALRYLTYLHKRFKNDWMLALAAYNSGEGTVSKAIKKNHLAQKTIHFYHLDLPKETQAYVPKLLALVSIVRDPVRYGVNLPVIENRPQLISVDIGEQIDLMLAAKLAEISIAEIYRLNPGYHQWATHPHSNGPHHLLLPIQNASLFEERVALMENRNLVEWQTYTVKHGDTLDSIAKKHHTNRDILKYINQISEDQIVSNEQILIPIQIDNKNLTLFRRCMPPDCKGSRTLLTHVVKNGETIASIAEKYKVSADDIRKWNALNTQNILVEKQPIVIQSAGV